MTRADSASSAAGGGRLIVLAGPTASGKTSTGLALAARFPLEIVNADSMQVFRGMDIGTAKPSPEERRLVPHHLIDVADPAEGYSAGRFVAEARAAMDGIYERGRFPLVVGGTGMYIRALLRGLDPLPADAGVREALERRWAEEGGAALYAELSAEDPRTAAKVHPADRVRILRALEIRAVAGVPASALRVSWERRGGWTAGEGGNLLFMALDPGPEETRKRIDRRVGAMIDSGLVEEVRGLLARGLSRRLKAMGALGYRHAAAHLLDGVPLDETAAAIRRDTRKYAKRQMTWLGKEPGITWIPGGDPVERASAEVRNFLI